MSAHPDSTSRPAAGRLLLGCWLLPLLMLLLIQMPPAVQGYEGHRRHQGPTGHLRANTHAHAAADNYTCYHAPVQPGVRGLMGVGWCGRARRVVGRLVDGFGRLAHACPLTVG